MLKTILVDDERKSLEVLELALGKHCPEVEVIASCQGPEAAIKAISEHAPDLVFLDIQMPDKNGFEMLAEIPTVDFEVIFVTAFDHYSIQAIKVSALDYLLKPVDTHELKAAVQKALENRQFKRSREQVDLLLTNLQKDTTVAFSKIALPTLKGLDFISIDAILYCSADGNYSTIVTTDGDQYVISRTLSEIEEMLDNPSFFRTHRSYLINLNYIKQYIHGAGGQVIMKGGISIQVARARKAMLMDLVYKKK